MRAALTEERQQQVAAARGKALAESAVRAAASAEKFLANEQRCLEAAECTTALGTMALAKEQHCQKCAELAVAMAGTDLAEE